jgi:4-hydroxy-3-methylbut-2-en-1-yl diphosphate synthase IspG/GcpE
MKNIIKSSITISLLALALIGNTIQCKKVTLEPNEQIRIRAASSAPSFMSALYDKPS